MQQKLKNLTENERPEKRGKEDKSKQYLKKGCFVNKTTRISQATSNTSDSNNNSNITQWIEASSSEEEDVKCNIKIHVETVN